MEKYMKLELKDRVKSTGGRILLAILVIIASVLCSLLSQLGIILIPVISVLLTILYISERGAKPAISLTVSVLLIVSDLIFNSLYSLCALVSVIIALLVYFSLTRSIFTKGECAIVVTFVIAILFGYMTFTSAFYEIGRVDFAAALEHFGKITEEVKDLWREAINSFIAAAPAGKLPEELTPELLEAMFDSALAATVSVVVIFSFLVAGITFKLLGAVLGAVLVDREDIDAWRFMLSPAYAYAYVIAYFVSMFFTEANVFSIAIINFVNAFAAILAYIGFVFVISVLEQRFSSKLAAVIVAVIALLMFSTAAVPILAFAGTFAVIMYDKAKKLGGKDDSKNP